MLKPLALVLVVAALAVPAAAAGPPADGVWVAGSVHTLVTGPPPAGAAHGLALYVIAPISAGHPLHPLATARVVGFGAHDHVFSIAHYTGVCDIHLVVPGPKAKPGSTVGMRMTLTPAGRKPLLYAARIGGTMVGLDRTSRIHEAATLGLAHIVDTKILLACTVTPRG